MINSLSIIFPLFNEEKRLPETFNDIEKFNKKQRIKNIEYIFVNDGSIDNTSHEIVRFIKSQSSNKIKYRLISLKKNFGKGYALKRGVEKSSFKWILTLDADISVSLLELNNWFKNNYLEHNVLNLIYFGSRSHSKSNVKFKIYRKILGIIFSNFVKFIFKTSLNDTQCGFKLYRKKNAKILFKNLKTFGFSHDVEILNLAKKFEIRVKELPVKWVHKKNSKLNIFFDPFKMFLELIFIKIKSYI